MRRATLLENGLFYRDKYLRLYFGMVISHMCIFLQISIYHRTAATRVSVAMVWVTPYKLFLKVPWVTKQLASSDFIFGTRKKAADAKYGKK
jgi:hypothetical protein